MPLSAEGLVTGLVAGNINECASGRAADDERASAGAYDTRGEGLSPCRSTILSARECLADLGPEWAGPHRTLPEGARR